MKILKNNYKPIQTVYKVICPHCKSELEYTDDDISGFRLVECPACHETFDHDRVFGKVQTDIDDDYDCPVHIDYLEFPDDENFYYFGNGKEISDEDTTKMIKQCVKELRKDSKTDYCLTATGDTLVIVLKEEDGGVDYEVFVAKDYYSAVARQ